MSSQPSRASSGPSAPANDAQSRRQQHKGGARPPRSKGAAYAPVGSTSKARSDQAPSMTSTIPSSAAPKKRKKKDSSGAQDQAAADKARLKVVVRKLPPNLPAAIFWRAVVPWVNDGKSRDSEESGAPAAGPRTADWLCFVPGKIKTRDAGGAGSSIAHHCHSRAYIRFTSAQALAGFHRSFDGHIFRDAKGSEHAAVVEFAPYQKVPADSGRRKKRDPRQGTLDEDADYQSFLESLKAEPVVTGEQSLAEKTEAQLLANLAANDGAALAERAKNTPLLEHLRLQRALLGRRKAEAKLSKAKVKGKEKVSKRKGTLEAKAPSTKKKESARKGKEKEKNVSATAPPPSGPKVPKGFEGAKRPPKAPRSKTKPTRATESVPQPAVAPQMILKRQAPQSAPAAAGPKPAPSRPPPTGPSVTPRTPSGPSIPTGPAGGNRGRSRGRGRGGGGGGDGGGRGRGRGGTET